MIRRTHSVFETSTYIFPTPDEAHPSKTDTAYVQVHVRKGDTTFAVVALTVLQTADASDVVVTNDSIIALAE